MNHWLILCLSVGICWASPPFLARLSQLSPWIMAGFVAAGTLIPVIPFLFQEDYSQLSRGQILLGILAGIFNGLGVLAWYKLVAGSSQGLWNIGTVLPVAVILLCVILVIGGRLIFAEPLTSQRLFGLVLATAAIYFLR